MVWVCRAATAPPTILQLYLLLARRLRHQSATMTLGRMKATAAEEEAMAVAVGAMTAAAAEVEVETAEEEEEEGTGVVEATSAERKLAVCVVGSMPSLAR